ncbi:MAG: C_GCAxxG_C_C family protein [Clostridia bacterium]|nr:C_GCAxxG_C_C family protein [Clostridia bacterium]
MAKGEIAREYFLSGYNCAVSVALAFKEELGLEEEQIKRLTIAFGGGLARQRLTCGAVSAMAMVIGYAKSNGESRADIYPIVQQACKEFKEQVGSLICGELLSKKIAINTSPVPEERTKEYYVKRPCADMCYLAGEIAERYLAK